MSRVSERGEIESPCWIALAAGALLVLGSGLSGVFHIPLVRSLPAILLLFVLLVQSVAYRRHILFPAMTVPTLGLLLLMVLGLVYSRAPLYGLAKTAAFCLFWVGFPVALFGVFPRRRDLSDFVRGIALGGILYGALLFAMVGDPLSLLGNAERFFRFSLEAQNPIYLGRAMAVSMIALLWVAAEPNFGWRRCVAAVSIPVLGGYLVATASKGPVFGFAVSSAVFGAMLGARVGRLIVLLLIIALVVAIAAPHGLQDRGGLSGARVVRTAVLSFEERAVSWSRALQGFERGDLQRMLFGVGTGGFAHLERGEDARHYPHNILLEALYENGVVGALLLLFFLLIPFRLLGRAWGAIRPRSSVKRLLALGCSLYVFALINAQVTGDLASNEWVPVTGALLVLLCRYARPVPVGAPGRSHESESGVAYGLSGGAS